MSEEKEVSTEETKEQAAIKASETMRTLLEQLLANPEIASLARKHLSPSPSEKADASPPARLGLPFELDIAGIGPGDTGQLARQAPGPCTLRAIEVDGGLEIVQVYAGPHVLKENFNNLDKPLQNAAWITVVAKNPAREGVVGKGRIFLEGEGLKPEAQGAGFGGAFEGGLAVSPPTQPQVFSAAPIPTAPVGPPKVDIKPGANEVVALFSYGEAQRLLQMIMGGTPIYDFEKPAYERRLKNALGMS